MVALITLLCVEQIGCFSENNCSTRYGSLKGKALRRVTNQSTNQFKVMEPSQLIWGQTGPHSYSPAILRLHYICVAEGLSSKKWTEVKNMPTGPLPNFYNRVDIRHCSLGRTWQGRTGHSSSEMVTPLKQNFQVLWVCEFWDFRWRIIISISVWGSSSLMPHMSPWIVHEVRQSSVSFIHNWKLQEQQADQHADLSFLQVFRRVTYECTGGTLGSMDGVMGAESTGERHMTRAPVLFWKVLLSCMC